MTELRRTEERARENIANREYVCKMRGREDSVWAEIRRRVDNVEEKVRKRRHHWD
jgi:hypothetical protein